MEFLRKRRQPKEVTPEVIGQESEIEDPHFLVIVEDYQELYNFLKPLKGHIQFSPQEFSLGHTSLSGVLQSGELSVVTTGQQICFSARFLGADDSSNFPIPYSVDHLRKQLRRAGLDKVHAWESPDRDSVVSRRVNIGSGNMFDSPFTIRDIVEDSVFGLRINDTEPWREEWREIKDFNQFKKEVDSFVSIVQVLVEAVYIEVGQNIPDTELVLRKEPVDESVLLVAKEASGVRPLTETEKPSVTFDKIGGQRKAVRKMREVAIALKHPESFHKWGTALPGGILLVGPPGNGKTLLGKAMAKEADAYFVPVNISDILRSLLGSTERRITALFEEARKRGRKTILFFDELDSLGMTRDKATREYSVSFLLTLNQNMDGIRENPNVIVIGTTNKKENMDPALLREGRFDILVDVPLPDIDGRAEILKIHLEKAENEAGRKIFEDINLDLLAERTEEANGARLAEVIRRVTWTRGVQESLAVEEGRQIDLPLISTQEILEVIKNYEER